MSTAVTLWRAVAETASGGISDPTWRGRWCHRRTAAERQARQWRSEHGEKLMAAWVERLDGEVQREEAS